jgi:hypothetical protein
MYGGPWQYNNPWGTNFQNAGSNKGGGQPPVAPIGPDFNLLGGSRHMGVRRNQ